MVTRGGRAWRRWVTVLCVAALTVLPAGPTAQANGTSGAARQPADPPKPRTIEPVAGGPEAGYSGDGHPAADARIGTTGDVAVGKGGTVYLTDREAGRVRAVDGDGRIDTVPGTRADESRAGAPRAVAAAGGALFVAGDEAVIHRAAGGAVSVLADVTGQGHENPGEDPAGDSADSAEDAAADADERAANVEDEAGRTASDLRPGDALPVVPRADDIAVDGAGAVYVSGSGTVVRIPKGDAGESTVVAGGGTVAAQEADGRPATDARLAGELRIAAGDDGALYLRAGADGDELYRVDPDGTMRTLVTPRDEPGFAGDGGPVGRATFGGELGGPAVGPRGEVVVFDVGNRVVRVIDRDGVVTSLTPPLAESEDGDAPVALAVGDDGAVYVRQGHRIHRLASQNPADPSHAVGAVRDRPYYPSDYSADEPGTVYPVAGADPSAAATASGADEPVPVAAPTPSVPDERRLRLATGSGGVLYYADTDGHRVLKVGRDGGVTVAAGTGEAGFAGDGGRAAAARLDAPQGIDVGPDGSLYIADTGNDRVRKVDARGVITTAAGDGTRVGTEDRDRLLAADGEPATDTPVSPTDVAVGDDGVLYVAEGAHRRLSRVDQDGTISTWAGLGSRKGSDGDGYVATAAALGRPHAITVSPEGRVFFLDRRGDVARPVVRMVDPAGVLFTIAGDADAARSGSGFSGDGGRAVEAELNNPHDLAVRGDGTLYLADSHNARVRAVDPAGRIRTVAGTGERVDGDDGQRARTAPLDEPRTLDVASDSSLRLITASGAAVRSVADGVLGTVASLEEAEPRRPAGPTAVQRPATQVTFGEQGIDALAVDHDGALLLADGTNPLLAVDRHGMLDTASAVDSAVGSPAVDSPAASRVSAVTVAPDGTRYVAAGDVVYRMDRGSDGTGADGADGADAAGGADAGDGAVAVPVAGGGPRPDGPSGDHLDPAGRATLSSFGRVVDLAAAENAVYVATEENVYRVDADGTVRRWLRDAGASGPAVGGIALGEAGEVFAAIPDGGQVWRIDPEGRSDEFAGVGSDGDSYWEGVDGLNASEVALDRPRDVAVDGDIVYIGTGRGVVRVDAGGTVLTVAGPEHTGAVGALALDRHGDLYFADLDAAQVSVVVQPALIEDPFHWEHIGGIVAVGVIVLFGVVRFGPQLWRRVTGRQDASARHEAELSVAGTATLGSDVDSGDEAARGWFDGPARPDQPGEH